MLATTALQHLERTLKFVGSRRDDLELVIAVHAPGAVGGSPYVGVAALAPGIDWNVNRVFVQPERDLSTLTEVEREAIVRNVRVGQSWHAYKAQEKLHARIAELEAEVTRLRAERAL